MRKQKAGIRSTQKKLLEALVGEVIAPQFKSKQKDIMVNIFDTNDELAMKVFTYQTGRFPNSSSRGNKYIMILCEVDSGGILVEPLCGKSARETTKAFEILMDRLAKQGVHTKHLVLDNEISGEFKEAVDRRQLTYQLVPPHDNRRNQAERDIQTFKAHLISILCGVDEKFQIELWCCLLPQAELTLTC